MCCCLGLETGRTLLPAIGRGWEGPRSARDMCWTACGEGRKPPVVFYRYTPLYTDCFQMSLHEADNFLTNISVGVWPRIL